MTSDGVESAPARPGVAGTHLFSLEHEELMATEDGPNKTLLIVFAILVVVAIIVWVFVA